jgi:hypothetical protein
MISNIIIIIDINIVKYPINDGDTDVSNDAQLSSRSSLQSPAHPSGDYHSLSHTTVASVFGWGKVSVLLPVRDIFATFLPAICPRHCPPF